MIWRMYVINRDAMCFILKMNGLMPFRFSTKTIPRATSSKHAVLFCSTIGIAILILLPIAQVFILGNLNLPNDDKLVNTLVFRFEIILRTMRSISLYFYQIINRAQFIDLINDGFRLYTSWTHLYRNDAFFDKEYFLCHSMKTLASVGQFIIVVFSFFGYFGHDPRSPFAVHVSLFLLIQYSNFMLTFVTAIYFWNMQFMAQFYRNLNGKLATILAQLKVVHVDKNQMRMQTFCDISDEIDQIAVFYEWLTRYTKVVVESNSVQLILLMMDGFVSILSQVSCELAQNGKNNNFFYIPIQLFNFYTDFLKPNQNPGSFINAVNDFAMFSFYAIEIYFMTTISSSVANEVCAFEKIYCIYDLISLLILFRVRSLDCYCISLKIDRWMSDSNKA